MRTESSRWWLNFLSGSLPWNLRILLSSIQWTKEWLIQRLKFLNQDQVNWFFKVFYIIFYFWSNILHLEILPIWVEEITKEFDSRPTTSRTASLSILKEIDFWRTEAAKLLRLKTEVSSDKIIKTLKCYNPKDVKEVGMIRNFVTDITAKHKEAVSNQNFLSTLEEPVKEIHSIPMENLKELFKNIFVYVFVIFKNSQFYSNP